MVRKTSRKGRTPLSASGILRGHTPALFRRFRKRMRWSDTRGDVGNRGFVPLVRVLESDITDESEIPCRVSSDLHEWRNDLGAVSTRDSAKLQYE
jgi:hypothetical protein